MKSQVAKLVLVGALGAAYYLGGLLGRSLATDSAIGLPVWPSAGLAVGALVVFGRGLWPGVFLGALILNLTTATSTGLNWPSATITALTVSVGNVGAALAGASVALRYSNGTSAFESVQSILRFLLLTPAVASLISATVGAPTLTIAGFSSWARFPTNWATWCLGDFVSVMIISPVFLAWASRPLPRVEWTRVAEVALLCLTLFGLALGTHSLAIFSASHKGELVVLTAPLLLWAALRFGPRGTSSVLLIMWALMIAQISMPNPLAGTHNPTSPLLVQAFIGLMGLMAFALAADVQRRTRAEEDLRLSEVRYRALFHENPEPVWVHDRETGRILDVNEAALRQYGYSRPQFLSLTAADLQAEESEREQRVRGSLRPEVSKNGESLAFHRKSDGSTVPVEVSRSDLMIAGRPATAVVSIGCAERVRSQKLATALAHLGQKLAGAREPRDAARAILGTAETLIGWDACSLSLVSADLTQLQMVLELDTAKGEQFSTNPERHEAGPLASRLIREGRPLMLSAANGGRMSGSSDRERNFASVMGAPIRKGSRIIGLVVVQSGRTHAYTEADLQMLEALADHCAETLDRIEIEQDNLRLNHELRHHLEELQAIFTGAPVGLAVCYDPECTTLIGNPAFDAMIGRQRGDLSQEGACDYKLLKGGRELPRIAIPMARALLQGEEIPGEEMQLITPDGRSRPCFVSASPLHDDSGGVRGSLGVFVDLTTLKAAEAAIEDRTERLRLAMAAGRMGTWSYDPGRRGKVYWSPELESLFGLAPGQFAGTPAAALQLIWKEDRTAVIESFAAALRGTGDYELEFRFHRPGRKKPGWMLGRGRAYADANGRLTRMAGVCLDITGRKEIERELLELNTELERRVHDRTAQLEAINKELEAFSYSVSHDLRAPLRSIRGFGEVLFERYSEQLDASGRDFLRRVCDSCYHMDRLIEDLLKLSRVGRAEMQPRSIDLSAVSAEITDAIRKSEPQRSIDIRIAPRLKAFGDERLLRVVLDNLLRNSWKFTRNQPAPVIEVGQLEAGEQPYFVRDNGAGFDMAYAGKLFGVFQRLHTTTEFPGTGIGLATVQRIVNRHGGRVWAHGEVGRGATIYFTLPPEPGKSHINQPSPEPKI